LSHCSTDSGLISCSGYPPHFGSVLFGNDMVTIDPQYKPQLLKLAQQAMGITGYVILVKGYASKVGSAALNQKLNTERAQNVANFPEQQGKIPLTNMLAPGAMGTSKRVAPDTTAEGSSRESPSRGEHPAKQRHRRNVRSVMLKARLRICGFMAACKAIRPGGMDCRRKTVVI
jgi:outer membrane protein OmpA-like peptidoglycan-associated protein